MASVFSVTSSVRTRMSGERLQDVSEFLAKTAARVSSNLTGVIDPTFFALLLQLESNSRRSDIDVLITYLKDDMWQVDVEDTRNGKRDMLFYSFKERFLLAPTRNALRALELVVYSK